MQAAQCGRPSAALHPPLFLEEPLQDDGEHLALPQGTARSPFTYSVVSRRRLPTTAGTFLAQACQSLGMRDFQSFQTVDLYEAKDMHAVLLNISALGSIAQKLGYNSTPARGRPTLGYRGER